MRKWREIPWLPAIAAPSAAVLATVLTFAVVALFAPRGSYVRELFFERSWIQHASTFCFWLTMALLVVKLLSLRLERRGFELARDLLAERQFDTILSWADADRVKERFEDPRHALYHRSLTFSRITKAMDRLRKTQSTGAVESYFRTRSDIDANELETGYAGVRYLTWLIPTLGFVGTVMGIGIGIAGFADIIQTARRFEEIQKSLPLVTHALGTAFDTTLLALGLSAVAVFATSGLLQRQEQLLEDVDNLCFDGVCALFQEHSTATDEVVEAIAKHLKNVITQIHGDRASVERVLRDELPGLITDRMAAVTRTLQEQWAEGQERATKSLVAELRSLQATIERTTQERLQ